MGRGRYFGDDRLRYRIENRKNRYTECIYCSKESHTREHVPSKVFLQKPFPDDLPTLPACYECNNAFSKKELLVSLLIQIMKKELLNNYEFPESTNGRIEKNEGLLMKVKNIIATGDTSKLDSDIRSVLVKLARGHSVWDLSKGYYIDSDAVNHDSINVDYRFLHEMTQDEINDFLAVYIVSRLPLPEIGSRLFDTRLLVYQDDTENINEVIVLWEEVQEGEYEYICYQFDNVIEVKIVINNFLFAKIHFKEM
ncbi:hypothetical protein ACFTQ7_12830 [Lysinibacillus sp. NPDC056959]|uniref:hypothetical protein n=1 Tax=Lysinibacillus sp. NPDC056959 TaxID=3345981 RepID=UPI003640E023